jgi:SpoVK/Ycf46/Vps4 family AAA+-type ATPase
LGSAIYASGIEHLQDEEHPAHLGEYLLQAAQAFPGIALLAGSAPGNPSRRFHDSSLVRFEFPVPHFDLRRRIWLAALHLEPVSEPPDLIAPRLAAAFQITEGQVRGAVAAARAAARVRSFSNPEITAEDLQAACRKQAGRRLLGFARRIEPTRHLTLDDVILSEPNKTQVRELLNRVRLRSRVEREMNFESKTALGKGLVVLLAGAPGTGKTLCAELIANQQGIDLYKVDVSAIVSKWVGQTEKNLSRVFAEAEDSDALLFFDECDSLFGQRGETASEASGRWANLQVNYLLTRIEEYSGVVVLATNLRKNIDEAFIRRIQVIIDFPTPDAGMRYQIWKRTLPATSTAITDDELHDIAGRFALTGGNMRNASIDAAFRALAAGRDKIVVRDLVDAVAREYQKVSKPITQGEFGAEFYGWALADILAPAPTG